MLGRDAWAHPGPVDVTGAAALVPQRDAVGATVAATGRTGAVDFVTTEGAPAADGMGSNGVLRSLPAQNRLTNEPAKEAPVRDLHAASVRPAADTAPHGRGAQRRKSRSLAGASLAATRDAVSRTGAERPDGFDAIVRRTGRRIGPRQRRR